jgi:hypothetical protein
VLKDKIEGRFTCVIVALLWRGLIAAEEIQALMPSRFLLLPVPIWERNVPGDVRQRPPTCVACHLPLFGNRRPANLPHAAARERYF